jgi:outer membrane protein assembly factor BamB
MNIKKTLCALFFSALLMASSAHLAAAQDWPGWRGPNRDGVLTSFAGPKSWPETLKLKWKTELGAGHSSPVVAGKRIYMITRRDDKEVVSCLDLDSGKTIWTDSYAAPYTMHQAAVGHGKGPKSTPVISRGKLYTFGISGILSCYDTGSGRLAWRREFSKDYKTTSPLFGTAMSPVVEGSLVIAHVGGHDNGALMAFQVETGETKWSWKGDGPGYASPIVVSLDGTRQVVTQTQKHIVGISAASGELLWSIPFKTEYDENIVTPVVYKQTLIFSGPDKSTFAVRVVKRDGKWATEQVWNNPQVSMYMSSPVIVGDLMFGFSEKRKGQFFCLDARTGETLWTTEGREGENAAILIGGDILFLLKNDAELIVARKGAKGLDQIKRYTVAQSPTWAHPVILGNRILVKDAATLALWGLD